MQALIALILGAVEGITEFLPVSSTGHLLLLGHFLGFESAGRTFEVVIQLGAILALLLVWSGRLFTILRDAPHDPRARRLVAAVLLAFLPAAVIGVIAHPIIKTVLFETPMLIAVMLILGGFVLIYVDKMTLTPRYQETEDIPILTAIVIGFVQCLAMIPGTSRSGATIVGALLMGVSKRAAAEFSFFLSMPTMMGAVAYDIYKTRDMLDWSATWLIVIGFVSAFVSAALVVRWLLGFVSRRGYALFGWWRIVVGTLALIGLSLGA
ncbi:undecaprenyl-diphosphate phosphatase [Pseudoroseicyclus aestuarii]|uniref:Undecaprenyl-diphosphatase n=1 Tax=Pseudoroseicyclus aestuarii TaxID=1795041 RepID=A0A318SVN0_9RHOB|nr:undecaprenyl-diphosphate phosphatase [Pseudoroseicyclus aestuarii]PYE84396.1 undecaprenyl-diphosphatase [Pseudoroseicyclus aestuarii]